MAVCTHLPPGQDIDPIDVEQYRPKSAAAGIPAVAVSLTRAVKQMGLTRTGRTLGRLNQAGGFDCMGCAWPDRAPGDRSVAEFCENGAKAVAEEATQRRITSSFFAEHSIEELAQQSDYWLGQQGCLTQPMLRKDGASRLGTSGEAAA